MLFKNYLKNKRCFKKRMFREKKNISSVFFKFLRGEKKNKNQYRTATDTCAIALAYVGLRARRWAYPERG